MALAEASLVAASLAAGLLTASPRAGTKAETTAETEAPDTAETRDDASAKQAFDEGLAAVADGQFDLAVVRFERAYSLRPHPVTLFNLALALEKAERRPEAWGLFASMVDGVDSDAERREIRRHMRELEAEIAVVEVDATPRSRLCIDGLTMPRGATSGYSFALDPGRHELTLDDEHVTLEFRPGDRRVLLLDDADELLHGRRQGPWMPAMLGTSIGAGGLAVVLGIGASAAQDRDAKTGLAVGATLSAGIAVAAGVVAILIETGKMDEPRSRKSQPEDALECPGSPELERRLDLRIAPTIEQPTRFADLRQPALARPDLPRPAMPPSPAMLVALPNRPAPDLEIQPPRSPAAPAKTGR